MLVIEGIMGRDLNVQWKERIAQVAFVVLLLFAVLVIFNDISKLSLFAHAKP
jgi:regulator of sigma E protease